MYATMQMVTHIALHCSPHRPTARGCKAKSPAGQVGGIECCQWVPRKPRSLEKRGKGISYFDSSRRSAAFVLDKVASAQVQ